MSTNLMSDQELQELFDRDILDLIGGGDLLPEKKQELYMKIAETVQNRAIARVYQDLSEEDGQKLDQLLESATAEEVQQFLRDKDLELPAILTQEAVAYKLEVYELFKLAKNQTLADANQNNQSKG
jgi:predicted house-cleaning noncanonical NTP pyrophosphatase (MazG superfamily)